MNFPGVNLDGGVSLFPPGLSVNLSAAVDFVPVPLSVTTPAANGALGKPNGGAVASSHRGSAGVALPMFGGELFEKIIVTPRSMSLGFVLTNTQFAVEVWNTSASVARTLTAITITGAGGVAITDPFGEPLVFAPEQGRVYQATVPTEGPAQIQQDVVFVFEGVSGTDMVVLGSRITLFSVGPDWSEGMSESIEYLTDVLKAYSDKEQRRGLRQFPRRALTYRALTLNARNAAGMEALVWGGQAQPYGVPWWPDVTPLAADLPPGSFVIPCKTTNRLFAAGGLVCIWGDEFTFEALSITDVASDSLTVSSPTQFAWKGSPATMVMPVLLARLPDSVKVSRLSSSIDQIDLTWIGEAMQPAPAPATALTQYLGFDVLEVAPNWEATLGRTYKRSLVTIDPKIGPITVIDKGGSAIVGQEFPWWLDGHANISAFRAFILRRFGQLTPFWVPTWDQDLELIADVGPADTGITIQSAFYSQSFFPSPARRYVAFIPFDGSPNVYRKITGATDNFDGTESLTLDSPIGKAFPAATTMISFLTLARLGADRTEIKWDTADHAESLLLFEEVPRELPA